MHRTALFFGFVCLAGPAYASDKPIYAAVPAWVKPALAIDTSKLGDDAPIVLLLDNQQRFEDGQVWTYLDTATRAASTQVLSAIGTIQLPWQPSTGDLIVHRAEIIRGIEHIDLLKTGTGLSVIRREQGVDQRALDGMLTATMPVPGLRVGDVLHLTFSITRKDPTLKGNVQTVAPLMFDPFRIQFARMRMLWPEKSDIRWKAYAGGLALQPVTTGGYRDLTLAMPLPKLPDMPKDAPARFQNLPIIEASSFPDWAAVGAVMAPLYATDGLIAPETPLDAEVERITKAESDPLKRAALALELVQSKIRYQLLGMDTGNYVPQTPAQTWTLRYGDCKAKTLLLLAMLHAMKIEAEPVLASSQLGDIVADRLPSPAAFDHILVRATIAGETLWLDGTGAGARLADIRDTPALGHVLPVRASGAVPIAIAMHADARPQVAADIELDESAGVNFPAPFKIAVVVRGGWAESIRLASAQASKDDVRSMAETMVKPYLDNGAVTTQALTFDEAAGTATVTATGIAYPQWSKQDGRLGSPLDTTLANFSFSPDRARPAWRQIPVATGNPTNIGVRTRIHLPRGGAGFTLEGDAPLSGMLAGTEVNRTILRSGEWLTIDARLRSNGAEIAASAIPEERKRVALAKSHLPRALAPADYPPFWQDVVAAKPAHRFDPILAAYARRIADKPDDVQGYTDRAWFLERIFERTRAVEDLTRAIAINADAATYLKRAALYEQLGDKPKAIADAASAGQIDPASSEAVTALARYKADGGDRAGALALLQERIDAGGEDKPDYLAAKAQIEADGGDKDAAIETIDAAIAQSPGKSDLLNSRCWIKGTMNVGLDTALKDCTKAIELSETNEGALDSRAMVYFRLNRFDDALADLDAALTRDPNIAASIYMRGVIRKRTGNAKAADADLLAARLIAPRIDESYKRFGIIP